MAMPASASPPSPASALDHGDASGGWGMGRGGLHRAPWDRHPPRRHPREHLPAAGCRRQLRTPR